MRREVPFLVEGGFPRRVQTDEDHRSFVEPDDEANEKDDLGHIRLPQIEFFAGSPAL